VARPANAPNSSAHRRRPGPAPDDVTVIELRRQWETIRHAAGDDGYVCPAHLISPGAAAYPPPALGFGTTTR
jgi:hypothetical protein